MNYIVEFAKRGNRTNEQEEEKERSCSSIKKGNENNIKAKSREGTMITAPALLFAYGLC